ncbi:DUF4271 domain-containing protein [Sediminibacterium sp.]|uniref:DUF4271 domain-containing protein n=1 Tax=Sediminibacterium sp. TaxID=1917865 RepID=UPI00272698EF|nr:DUF4271 domain-containing protein [Sediminibacterium sp.]MDO9000410.1 DUF4271 domain-containing protein [Bacteroidota bacterium]MDP3147022.1 DUF4271 domain-containing protein [Bacteroidota bacterium]MDP3567441.1 DUF4271 domain-containing protein [Sediminibacterium sp.]
MDLELNNHLFYNHLLQKQHLTPLLKNNPYIVWTSLFFLFCFGLLVFIKVTSYSKVLKIIQSTFNSNALHELEREETKSFKLHSLLLSLFYFLNISFLLYKLNSFYKFVFTEQDLFVQFSFILLLVLLFVGLKSLLNQFICFLTNNYKTLSDYGYNSLIISQTFGVFLFPWLILSELTRFNSLVFISGAFVVLMLSFLYKWYRGIIISLIEERVGLLQTFAYFCALEILPVIVLVKYIIETF